MKLIILIFIVTFSFNALSSHRQSNINSCIKSAIETHLDEMLDKKYFIVSEVKPTLGYYLLGNNVNKFILTSRDGYTSLYSGEAKIRIIKINSPSKTTYRYECNVIEFSIEKAPEFWE